MSGCRAAIPLLVVLTNTISVGQLEDLPLGFKQQIVTSVSYAARETLKKYSEFHRSTG